MSNIEVPSTTWFTFHLNAGEDWTRSIVAQNPALQTQAVAQAKMEVRNSMNILVMTLDSTGTNPAITINGDGSLTLHMTTAQTLQFGVGFPGVIQSVGYWGVGRAYIYDMFVKYGSTSAVWSKLMYGTIQVTPAVTVDLS